MYAPTNPTPQFQPPTPDFPPISPGNETRRPPFPSGPHLGPTATPFAMDRLIDMTVSVPRHELPDGLGRRAEELDKSTAENIAWLESSPAGFRLAFGTALLAALTHCGEDPRAASLPTWEAWVTATQVGSALFATSMAASGTVKCRIADEVRTIPATGSQYHSNPENWINAFWLAIVCGEPERMTALAQVPLEHLRASGADYDEYVYPWIETLQTWWLRVTAWARCWTPLWPALTLKASREPTALSCCGSSIPR